MTARLEFPEAHPHVALVTIDRPEAGETLTVAVTPGLRVVLEFDPAARGMMMNGSGAELRDASGRIRDLLGSGSAEEDRPFHPILGERLAGPSLALVDTNPLAMLEDHPKFGFMVTRVQNGRMVQISDWSYCKHAFLSLNDNGSFPAICGTGPCQNTAAAQTMTGDMRTVRPVGDPWRPLKLRFEDEAQS